MLIQQKCNCSCLFWIKTEFYTYAYSELILLHDDRNGMISSFHKWRGWQQWQCWLFHSTLNFNPFHTCSRTHACTNIHAYIHMLLLSVDTDELARGKRVSRKIRNLLCPQNDPSRYFIQAILLSTTDSINLKQPSNRKGHMSCCVTLG